METNPGTVEGNVLTINNKEYYSYPYIYKKIAGWITYKKCKHGMYIIKILEYNNL